MKPLMKLQACALALIFLSNFSHGENPDLKLDKEYSAEIETKVSGHVSQMKIYSSQDKMRTELEAMGTAMTSIIRFDKKEIWNLMEATKQVMKMPLPQQALDTNPEEYLDKAEWEKVGDEAVDGIACEKWKATLTKESGEATTGYFWINKENRNLVQTNFKGVVSIWKNYQAGTQEASLFEVPEGYSETKMPDIGNLFRQ